MRPILLPLVERASRHALERRSGFTTAMKQTPLGRVHVYDAPGLGSLPRWSFFTASRHRDVVRARARAPPPAGEARRRLRLPGARLQRRAAVDAHPEALFETTASVIEELLGEEPSIRRRQLARRRRRARLRREASGQGARPRAALAGRRSVLRGGVDRSHGRLRGRFAKGRARAAFAIQHRPPFVARLLAHDIVAHVQPRAVRDLVEHTTRAHVVVAEDVGRLTMPILFSWGRSEKLFPASHLSWWRKHLPAHALVEEPALLGHCPHLDSPSRVADRIVSFAERLDGASST